MPICPPPPPPALTIPPPAPTRWRAPQSVQYPAHVSKLSVEFPLDGYDMDVLSPRYPRPPALGVYNAWL